MHLMGQMRATPGFTTYSIPVIVVGLTHAACMASDVSSPQLSSRDRVCSPGFSPIDIAQKLPRSLRRYLTIDDYIRLPT